jgi:hypothetical protein
MMATVISAVLAMSVNALTMIVLRRAKRLPAALAKTTAGLPLFLGLLTGLAALVATGSGLTLIRILLGAALLIGLTETVLAVLGAHFLWRLLGQVTVIGATLGFEWHRGDLFLIDAALALAGAVAAFNVITFATGAAVRAATQHAGASRLPSLLGLLGALYLMLIAHVLPNPGLFDMLAVIAAALLPLLALDASGPGEVMLGALLGAASFAAGLYAWLANASPTMVFAPLAIIGLDVFWTLIRRLTTVTGRQWLAASANRWRGLNRWTEPANDLVVQRAADRAPKTATGWLIAASMGSLALGLATWWLDVRWLLATLPILLLALGWLLIELKLIGLSTAELISWLSGLTALSLLSALAGRLSDGRLSVTALPLAVVALVWVVALIQTAASTRGGVPTSDIS